MQYIVWTIWGFVIGAMMYFFTYNQMGGVISSAGQINDYWNTGVVVYFINVVSHHVMIFAETRDWNLYIVPLYTFSFCLLFLVIWMNDVFSKSVFQGN